MAIIAVSSVVAEEETQQEIKERNDCLGQYLKNKGKLEQEFQFDSNRPSMMCRFILPVLTSTFRDEFEKSVQNEMPAETTCVMTEIDNTGLVDLLIKIAFYEENATITADEKKVYMERVETEANEDERIITKKCNVTEEKFEKAFEEMLKN